MSIYSPQKYLSSLGFKTMFCDKEHLHMIRQRQRFECYGDIQVWFTFQTKPTYFGYMDIDLIVSDSRHDKLLKSFYVDSDDDMRYIFKRMFHLKRIKVINDLVGVKAKFLLNEQNSTGRQ